MDFRPLPPRPTGKRDTDVAFVTCMKSVRTMGRYLAAFALCFVGLMAGACGSDATGSLDERNCQGDVGQDCPATYDESLADTWTCQSFEVIVAGQCMTGGPLTLSRQWGTHQSNCFYDATSRKLTGANVVNDTKAYCNGTSASMSSGNVPVPYPHDCAVSSAGTDRSVNCSAGQP